MSRRRPTARGTRGYIRERLEAKLGQPDPAGKPYNQTSLGEAMELTRGQVWHLLNPVNLGKSGGVGRRTIDGFLKLFDLEIGSFEEAVLQWEDAHPEELSAEEPTKPGARVVYEERYPNRARAAEFARVAGVAERAIEIVLGFSLASQTDPNPREWLRWMEEEEGRLRREELGIVERRQPVLPGDVGGPPVIPPRKK